MSNLADTLVDSFNRIDNFVMYAKTLLYAKTKA